MAEKCEETLFCLLWEDAVSPGGEYKDWVHDEDGGGGR